MDWASAPEMLKDASAMDVLNGWHPLADLPAEQQKRLDAALDKKLTTKINGREKKQVIEYPFLCEYEGCLYIIESGHHRGQHYRRHKEGKYGVRELRA